MMELFNVVDVLGRKRSIWWKIRQILPWWMQNKIFDFRMCYQRITRGFDDRFWWSHHSAHSYMMVSMFDIFIKNHVGYPMSFKCKHTKKANCDCGSKKWESKLEIMRDGFKAAVEWEDLPYGRNGDKKRKLLEKKFKNGMKLYTLHYFSLWD